MLKVLLPLDKIAVCTKYLIDILRGSGVISNKSPAHIDISNSFFTVSPMDMVHLQSSSIRETTVFARFTESLENKVAALVSFFVSILASSISLGIFARISISLFSVVYKPFVVIRTTVSFLFHEASIAQRWIYD